jgi:FkbM family methyltransferase
MLADETRRLRSAIAGLYDRFRRGRLTADDLFVPGGTDGKSDASWMRDAIAKRRDLQPDACVFKHFNEGDGAILDIGAHWGYTALAMRLSGTDCRIVSIDASDLNNDCLDELKLWDQSYDYFIQALGERSETSNLYTPTVNGLLITGLTNVNGDVLTEHHGDFLASLLGSHIPVASEYRVQLVRQSVTLQSLDAVIAAQPFRFPMGKVTAVKLDVEDYEIKVLRGAARLFNRDRPFVMIEGANRAPEVVEILTDFGYLFADRAGDQVVLSSSMSEEVNGFWLHRDRADEYRAGGLLV